MFTERRVEEDPADSDTKDDNNDDNNDDNYDDYDILVLVHPNDQDVMKIE